MELFSIFLYTFTINFTTTGVRKMPIWYMFCFICKNHFVAQKCGLFSSVFKKFIPNNTTPTFQDVGGEILSLT